MIGGAGHELLPLLLREHERGRPWSADEMVRAVRAMGRDPLVVAGELVLSGWFGTPSIRSSRSSAPCRS